jgi:Trm5-related predicted tRNA methylase
MHRHNGDDKQEQEKHALELQYHQKYKEVRHKLYSASW